MNRIDELFQKASKSGQKVFVPFLVAGDPDLSTTMRVAADISGVAESMQVPMLLELGFPYSDPLADGPTIQSAYTHALDQGVRVADIFSSVREFRTKVSIPMVGMVSFTIVHRLGGTAFLAQARDAGLDGVIIPDLPVEESNEMLDWGRSHDFKIVQLLAPTTRPDRMPTIASSSTGFLYYISVTGITGERKSLPTDLVARVGEIRRHANVPVCVGFGVSEPGQVRQLAEVADGVIVGSALVRRVSALRRGESTDSLVSFVRSLLEPLAPARG